MNRKNLLQDDRNLQDKLRGGYYTSPLIAKWLSNWAIRSSNDRILEPSCGDGVFIETALNRLLARDFKGSYNKTINRSRNNINRSGKNNDKAKTIY